MCPHPSIAQMLTCVFLPTRSRVTWAPSRQPAPRQAPAAASDLRIPSPRRALAPPRPASRRGRRQVAAQRGPRPTPHPSAGRWRAGQSARAGSGRAPGHLTAARHGAGGGGRRGAVVGEVPSRLERLGFGQELVLCGPARPAPPRPGTAFPGAPAAAALGQRGRRASGRARCGGVPGAEARVSPGGSARPGEGACPEGRACPALPCPALPWRSCAVEKVAAALEPGGVSRRARLGTW